MSYENKTTKAIGMLPLKRLTYFPHRLVVSKPVCGEESSETHKNTTLGDSSLIALGWGLGIGSFEEFPRQFNYVAGAEKQYQDISTAEANLSSEIFFVKIRLEHRI